MTATRTDICPPLSRIAIAIADYLIPLSEDQRDDVIARALCVVDDRTPSKDKPIPYMPTERTPSPRATTSRSRRRPHARRLAASLLVASRRAP